MVYKLTCPECKKMTDIYFDAYNCQVEEIFSCEQCQAKFAAFLYITIASKTYKLTDTKQTKKTKESKPGRKKPGPKPKEEKKPGRKKPGPKPQKKKTKK